MPTGIYAQTNHKSEKKSHIYNLKINHFQGDVNGFNTGKQTQVDLLESKHT